MGLGLMARDGKAVPAAWARTWAIADPIFPRHTPFLRCREYFDELFDARYRDRFGAGVVLKPNKTLLRLEYRPASASFANSVVAETGLPDVTVLKEPAGQLRALAEECCQELDSYSRYVGRNPTGAKDVAGLALLPPVLVSQSQASHVRQLRDRLASVAGTGTLLQRDELLRLAAFGQPSAFAKREAVALAQVLASAGFGIEPDVRFGGPVPGPQTKMYVFPLKAGGASAPTQAYSAATLLIRLAALIAAADGSISAEEQRHLESHVATALHLSEHERFRLDAHLRWVLGERPGVGGIKKRLDALAASQREAIGHFLIGVANADGCISPEEIDALGKMYRMLGLNTQDVYSHAHAAATEPVTVKPAESAASGFALPPRRQVKPKQVVQLNADAIEAKLRETAAVSALLSSVFVEEQAAPASIAEEAGCIPGLNPEASAFARLLVTKATWSRDELENAADAGGLLLDGTIEAINEAAFDACNEAVLEGADPLDVNIALLIELIERTVTA